MVLAKTHLNRFQTALRHDKNDKIPQSKVGLSRDDVLPFFSCQPCFEAISPIKKNERIQKGEEEKVLSHLPDPIGLAYCHINILIVPFV